jgi:16S rRNA (guanine966-N2)-methyltransferase
MKLIARELPGARVLDLFAGSGALGLEALSHGARSCDFVENNPSALHALKANVAKLRLREQTRVFKRDAIPFVEQLAAGAYDIAFADPPYASKKLERVHQQWMAVPFSRILVLEHAADHPIALSGRSVRVEDSIVTVLAAGAT